MGRSCGNRPLAALIAAWTSSAAASILRLRLNCSVMLVRPSMLLEEIAVRPLTWARLLSRGLATALAMVSASAPGRLVETLMVGNSMSGSAETGSWK